MRRWVVARAAVLGGAAVLALVATACEPAPTASWRSELVSLGGDGTTVPTGGVSLVDVSPDGTQVLFVSRDAAGLGFSDTSSASGPDLYLRDTVTGEVVRVTSTPDRSDGGDGSTSNGTFSADGRSVVFTTYASNLGLPDTNAQADVIVYDVATGALEMASVNATGTDGGNSWSQSSAISPDGTRVAFTSRASDLGPNDGNGSSDVYVRDLSSDTTELVSANATGTGSGNSDSSLPESSTQTRRIFTADGETVLFGSTATDLTDRPTAGGNNVFLRHLGTGHTTRVSQTTEGDRVPDGAASISPVMSPDGTKVVFVALTADATVPPPSPPFRQDLYVRDVAAGTLTRLLRGGATEPTMSADGQRVAFTGTVDAGLPDTNGQTDVYVLDITTGTLDLASVDASGTRAAAGRSSAPAFSPDGRLSFVSTGADILPGTSTASTDLYLRDVDAGSTELVTVARSGAGRAGGVATGARFSSDGAVISFASTSQILADRPVPAFQRVIYFARFTPFPNADLAITSAVPARYVPPGGLWSIGVTATNQGPEAVEGVTVTQIVPVGVDGVAATATASGLPATCSVAPAPSGLQQVASCTVTSLAVGESVEILVNGTVGAVEIGSSLTGVSGVSATRVVDPDRANNTVVSSTGVVAPGPDTVTTTSLP